MSRPFNPNFTYAMKYDKGFIGPEYDVEVVADASVVSGEPAFDVHAVYLDTWHREGLRCVADGRVNLLNNMDPLLCGLGRRIATAALDNETFTDRLIEEAGIMYRGLGGNDPDGRWVYDRSAAE